MSKKFAWEILEDRAFYLFIYFIFEPFFKRIDLFQKLNQKAPERFELSTSSLLDSLDAPFIQTCATSK